MREEAENLDTCKLSTEVYGTLSVIPVYKDIVQ